MHHTDPDDEDNHTWILWNVSMPTFDHKVKSSQNKLVLPVSTFQGIMVIDV